VTLFDRLDAWRHVPAYQLERRADIFFWRTTSSPRPTTSARRPWIGEHEVSYE
jgi:hypothetical protein